MAESTEEMSIIIASLMQTRQRQLANWVFKDSYERRRLHISQIVR